MKFRLAFLLEQTLGHVAHTKNIERALSSHPWVEPTVIKLPFDARPRPTAWVPGGRNWSVRASLMARARKQAAERAPEAWPRGCARAPSTRFSCTRRWLLS